MSHDNAPAVLSHLNVVAIAVPTQALLLFRRPRLDNARTHHGRLVCSQSAWRFLQQEVSRRLKCVVRAAVANYLNARCEQAVRASRRRAAVDAKPLQVIPAEGIQGRGQVTAVVDTAAEAQVAGSATVPSGNSVRGISPLQPAIRVQPADATQAAPRAPKLPSSDKGPKGMKQTTLPFARLNLVPTQAGRVVSPEMEPVFPTTAAVEGKVVEAIVLD